MKKSLILMGLLSFLVLIGTFQTAKATSITTATLDKTTYLAGQTGYISVTIYNDHSDKIRVTQLSATIDYYYTDGTVYIQTFYYPSDSLPDEIQAGQSKTYQIPISLPTNIAAGYTSPSIYASTQLYHSATDNWTYSDTPSYNSLKLYVESPYKQLYETSQQQLQDQRDANQSLTNTMDLLAVTTVVFAAAAGFLMFLAFTKKPKPIPPQ
jgi:hypothetical protein